MQKFPDGNIFLDLYIFQGNMITFIIRFVKNVSRIYVHLFLVSKFKLVSYL